MYYNSALMTNDATLVMRMPDDLKKALRRAAKGQMRTMSSMAAWILASWLRDQGFLAAAPQLPTRKKRA